MKLCFANYFELCFADCSWRYWLPNHAPGTVDDGLTFPVMRWECAAVHHPRLFIFAVELGLDDIR